MNSRIIKSCWNQSFISQSPSNTLFLSKLNPLWPENQHNTMHNKMQLYTKFLINVYWSHVLKFLLQKSDYYNSYNVLKILCNYWNLPFYRLKTSIAKCKIKCYENKSSLLINIDCRLIYQIFSIFSKVSAIRVICH